MPLPYIGTIKTNLMFYLDIPDCKADRATWTPDYVEYPCGLIITTEMMFESIQYVGHAFAYTHQNHHDSGHADKGWQLIHHIEEGGDTVTVTVTCNCR